VVRAFLQGDAQALNELDQYVQGLSEPYCQLIHDLMEELRQNGGAAPGASTELRVCLEVAETRAREAESRAQQINDQLSRAITIYEEVQLEYTKMFEGTPTAEELQLSSERVLQALAKVLETTDEPLLQELSTGSDTLELS
jgi:gamma-glutamyl:cysteine ligase YbdK (ATP-grasp superfamily)